MTELKFRYTDENGEEKLLDVGQEKFSVGRHSENDLSIPNSAVSRKHVKIERFADIFMISDVGSSLGTTINDKDLTDPVALYNGDKINLGGNFVIEVVLISDQADAGNNASNSDGADSKDEKSENDAAASMSSAPVSAGSGGGGSSIPPGVFYLAPILSKPARRIRVLSDAEAEFWRRRR